MTKLYFFLNSEMRYRHIALIVKNVQEYINDTSSGIARNVPVIDRFLDSNEWKEDLEWFLKYKDSKNG